MWKNLILLQQSNFNFSASHGIRPHILLLALLISNQCCGLQHLICSLSTRSLAGIFRGFLGAQILRRLQCLVRISTLVPFNHVCQLHTNTLLIVSGMPSHAGCSLGAHMVGRFLLPTQTFGSSTSVGNHCYRCFQKGVGGSLGSTQGLRCLGFPGLRTHECPRAQSDPSGPQALDPAFTGESHSSAFRQQVG